METLALTVTAWQLMEQLWWMFKSGIQEKTETYVEVWRSVSQLSPMPIFCKLNQRPSLTERWMLEFSPIPISVMGERIVLKLIQVYQPTTKVNFRYHSREMMMGVLQQCATLMLRRGFSKEMRRWTRWTLREEAKINPHVDEFPSPQHPLMMNVIIWNCRGALKPSFKSHVQDLIVDHDPAILVIMETVGGDRAKEISDTFPLQGAIHMDTVGYVGGLWFLWNLDRVEITNLASTEQEIHALVKYTGA
ncbi:uncharacterized protein LOC142618248 [Castanea sativa]|uniref:uncharacterized protein LOC142618248 n=1 Tax=Castanea sativa TaxID=21020 RepID=UPI003F653677